MDHYYEDLWQRLPAGLVPPDLEVRTRFLLSHVEAGQEVLDLGCGDGTFTQLMLEHAEVTVTAAEVAGAALRRAQARPGLAGRPVSYVKVPFDGDLPLVDNRFDVVWASEVIEHVADTGRWLSEVRRVLRPGGLVLVTTPNHTRIKLALGGIAAVSPPLGDHLHLYDRASLREVLGEFGFDPVTVRAAGRLGPSGGVLLGSARR